LLSINKGIIKDNDAQYLMKMMIWLLVTKR
jgi:hypothetical protein